MKIQIIACSIMVVVAAAACPAVTIFETFDYDVIADTTDNWHYLEESEVWGGISYQMDNQYLSLLLSRSNLVNKTCRLYMNLDPEYSTAPECWIEFDFRTQAGNSGTVCSLIGMFDKDSTVQSGFNHFGMCQGNNSDILGQSKVGGYTGNTWRDDDAITSGFIVGQAYRAKGHIYTAGDGNQYIALSIYSLNGNAETLIHTDSAQTKVMVQDDVTSAFNPALDVFGITNTSGNVAVGHRYDVDNLYFSTEGANANTITPFMPMVTFFETFDYDVIADTTDGWHYVEESSAWGGISYQRDNQYLSVLLSRTTLANKTCRLYTDINPAYCTAPESWIEFDFRTQTSNSGTVCSLIGMFDKDSTVQSGFNHLGIGQGNNSDILAQSKVGGYTGNTWRDDDAITSGFVVGQAYRAKGHIYTAADDNQYIALSIYWLDGNTETLIHADSAQTEVMIQGDVTDAFNPALDVFGITNTSGDVAAGHRYDVDNLYFSTEGANANTVEPFVPSPTIFETFDYDVIADTTDCWHYSEESEVWGGIFYQENNQYLSVLLSRSNLVNKTCRLYMNLNPAYSTAPASWIEFDFRIQSGNSGTVCSLIGMFDKDSTVHSGFNHLGIGHGNNSDILGQSKVGGYTGNTWRDDDAITSGFVVGQAYRAKGHIYTAADDNQYIALSIYSLDGNTETLIHSDSAQTEVMVQDDVTDAFNPALDVFGITNTSGDVAAGHRYDVDNLYFSREGANSNTVEPFVPAYQPGTVLLYAAPVSRGNGSGFSPGNAAYYLASTFWDHVADELDISPVRVTLLDGIYSGTLDLTNRGDPMHLLTLMAESRYGVIFNGNGNHQIVLLGVQNITLEGIKFTGEPYEFAVYSKNNGVKVARNITYRYCLFEDLYRSVLGVLNGNRNTTVSSCTFRNSGYGGEGSHMIYCDHDSRGITITDCSFTDCQGGDYIRFRNQTDYAIVDNCSFRSTDALYNHESILIPAFNSTDPGKEFYGTNFQITNNHFQYDEVGGYDRRYAVEFRCDGFNVPSFDGLDFWTDPSEAAILNTGTAAEKAAILGPEMDLHREKVKFHGNTFDNVSYQMGYWHHPNYGSGDQGYTSICNISNWPSTSGLLDPIAALINGGFEFKGSCFRAWHESSLSNPHIRHSGLDGTNTAVLSNETLLDHAIYQWINNATPLWAFECLFAIGDFTGTGTKFRIDIGHNELKDERVSFWVNHLGQVGLYNGTGTVILTELGTVNFSSDNNSDGDYSDPGDTLYWYNVRISGDYYSGAGGKVRIGLSNSNTRTLSRFSGPHSYWVWGAPRVGDRPGIIKFYTRYCAAIIDEVSFGTAMADDCTCD